VLHWQFVGPDRTTDLAMTTLTTITLAMTTLMTITFTPTPDAGASHRRALAASPSLAMRPELCGEVSKEAPAFHTFIRFFRLFRTAAPRIGVPSEQVPGSR
jgi:hypothetical protein